MAKKSPNPTPKTANKTPAPKTAEVAIAAARDHGLEKIIKAAELIRARPAKGKTLGLAAAKAFNLMIGVAGKDGFADKVYAIPKRDIRRTHKSNEYIGPILEELQTTLFIIETVSPQGKSATLRGSFLEFTLEEHDDSALIYFKLTDVFRKVHARSNLWAALSGPTLIRFNSTYALRLYEIGCQMVGRRDPTMLLTVPELREILQVRPGKYRDWNDLRRKTLDAAVKEINDHAHFTVLVPEDRIRRSGRKVVSLELQFWQKPEDDALDADHKPQTQRTGRKGRPKGAVPPLPALWGRVVRRLQDMDTGMDSVKLRLSLDKMTLDRIEDDTAIITVQGFPVQIIRSDFAMLLARAFEAATNRRVTSVDIIQA